MRIFLVFLAAIGLGCSSSPPAEESPDPSPKTSESVSSGLVENEGTSKGEQQAARWDSPQSWVAPAGRGKVSFGPSHRLVWLPQRPWGNYTV